MRPDDRVCLKQMRWPRNHFIMEPKQNILFDAKRNKTEEGRKFRALKMVISWCMNEYLIVPTADRWNSLLSYGERKEREERKKREKEERGKAGERGK